MHTLEKFANAATTISIYFSCTLPMVSTTSSSLLATLTTANNDYHCNYFNQQSILYMQFDGKNLVLFQNDFLTATLFHHQWSNST
eukprot:12228636-Ditylum_brightwellii.AAC.2